MGWTGYYINLDRSPERRAVMEGQLAQLGLAGRYRRLAACDGRSLPQAGTLTKGEAGIFRSHIEALRIAAGASGLTHVVEDDVWLGRRCGPFLDWLSARGLPAGMDMVVTDTGMADDLALYRALREVSAGRSLQSPELPISILDISGLYCWGLTSYVVSPHGALKLLAAFEAHWAATPSLPVDRVLESAAQAGRIAIGCTLPLLTWLHMEHASRSVADRNEHLLMPLVQRLARYPFFTEADIPGFFLPTLRRLIGDPDALGEARLHDAARLAIAMARQLRADAWRPSGPAEISGRG